MKESGGRVIEISDAGEAHDAFAQIIDDLRRQVAIGYYAVPTHGDGRWREIEVRTPRLGVRLRHAEGYFDD